jgi:O-antigen/teichoic acid export membrane protein
VREQVDSLRRFAVLLSTGLGGIAVVGGGLAYVVLPALGPSLFPETWETARPVLPVLTFFAAAVGASTGPIAALRALRMAGWIVRNRTVSGCIGLVAGLVLAAEWGATGALAGLTLSETGFALAAWMRLREALEPSPSADQTLHAEAGG